MSESLSFDAVLERVRRAVSQALQVELEAVGADRPLSDFDDEEDGPLTSGFRLLQVFLQVRDEFQLTIPDEQLGQLETAYELASYIYQRLTLQPATSPPPPQVPRKRSHRAPQNKQQAAREPSRPDAWLFHRGHWEPGPQESRHEDAGTPLPLLRLGSRQRGFAAEVFARAGQRSSSDDWAYRIQVWIGSEENSIFVTDLPSLLSLLDRLAAIVQGTGARDSENP